MSSIVKPINKFTLTDLEGVIMPASEEMDVSECVPLDLDLEVELLRDGASGVFSEVSFPIRFHGEAMDFIKALFEKKGLRAQVLFRAYKRGDSSNDYTLVKKMLLDFETYWENNMQIEIESANEELSELINSDGKNKYDIPVNELSPQIWKYSRINLLNIGKYEISEGDGTDGNASTIRFEISGDKTLPVYSSPAELVMGGPESVFQSVDIGEVSQDSYFFELGTKILNPPDLGGTNVKIKIDAEFKFRQVWTTNSSCKIILQRIRPYLPDAQFQIVRSWDIDQPDPSSPNTYTKHIQEEISTDYQMGGYRYILCASCKTPPISRSLVWCSKSNEFSVSYLAKGSGLDIPVIKPEVLLRNLLDKLSGPGRFTSQIDWGGLYPATPMICAAESVRNFKDAQIHTSLNDFIEWMQVLGYVYEAENDNMSWRPRSDFFHPELTALTLDETEVADLRVEANGEYAYTGIKAGYDKQDYESVNGRFEVNGTFEYSTGYSRKDPNVLELISPYRADPIGIELLCNQRSNSSTDTRSDNDIFFVALTQYRDYYETYMGLAAVEEEVSMFNAVYNPYFLVKNNLNLIGINTDSIKFASTDMNRNASIQGYNIFGDIPAKGKGLFQPVVYNFATGNFKHLPDGPNRNGLIRFSWQGKELQGYIYKIRKNYALETETTWELWKVK